MNTEEKPLSIIRIALIYVGSLVGAGFASGREAWQFYGVFGREGILGALVSMLLFASLGYMTAYIAHKKNTGDISLLVSPIPSNAVNVFVGIMMCLFLLVAYVTLTAAGGALMQDKIGIPVWLGSLIICLACIITALGGFRSVSAKLGKITPVLVCFTLGLSIYLIATNPGTIASLQPHETSKVASHWLSSAVAYVGYNGTAAVPVIGQCAMHSESEKKTLTGASLGGIILGLCCLILFLATSTDPALSASSSFPMMDLCARLLPALGIVYAVMLLLAIFMAQTTVFYGFTTKLREGKYRNAFIWGVGIAGYGLSLYGFSNMVANVLPVVGYVSLAFFGLEIVNFISVRKSS